YYENEVPWLFEGNLLKKFCLITSIILLVPLLSFGFYTAEQEKKYILLEKEEELRNITTLIERKITVNFEDILAKENAYQLPDEQKALILNKYMQPIVDSISRVYPNYGIGIASRELARRVALAPGFSEDFITQPVYQNLVSKVYNYGEPDVFQVQSANWEQKPALVAAYPIFQNGKLVGHTWANTKIEDINLLYAKSIQQWVLLSLGIWVSVILVITFFFQRLNFSIKQLVSQISEDDDGQKTLAEFPQLLPVLDTVIRLRNKYLGESEKLKLIINACPFAIVVVDSNGIITAHNHEYSTMNRHLGLNESLIGISVVHMLQKAGIGEGDIILVRALKGENIVQETINYAGRTWLATAIRFYNEDNKEILGALGVYGDITERESIRCELEKLDRLNLVGEMAASVAHEIRNPMTTVRGYLQFMSKKSGDKDRYDILISELDRANSIIEDFLSLARSRTVNKELCSLNEIISSLQPLLYADAVKDGIVVELELEAELPNLQLHKKEIKQLVLNLYRNAAEAISSISANGRIIIRTTHINESICLEAEDNGCGIPEDSLKKVMEPFYTTKGNGTGLGLAICLSIAGQHNAALTIDSTVGAGTTVRVKFPIKVS
ncbi:ATP-binding protein, partial [Sporomusa sp.]|uniref:ATP-binding protein n=1 Tax=Sporomusa sp. TaxID=2078658 RepID=UPI002B651FE5